MTVIVPIRQMKDIDQHVSWNSGPVFRDLKQKASKKKRKRTLEKILENCTTLFFFQSKFSGTELIFFEELKKTCLFLLLVIYKII